VAHGHNARGKAWEIGIKTPDIDAHDVVTTVPLENASLTTSGSYHNFFVVDGKRYSHILDPKTGAPVDGDLVSVTVSAPDALTADGWDTPFVIVGEERARAIIARHPGMAAMFIHDAPTGWRITTTPGFPIAAR
jgi:thiamine biosynthesis lipoprotein